MSYGDSIAVSASYIFAGLFFILMSFGQQRKRYYASACLLVGLIIRSLHKTEIDVATGIEALERLSLVACVLLIIIAMINYVRLQNKRDKDAEDTM